MNKNNNEYIILAVYLIVLTIFSIVSRNVNFLIVASICFTLMLSAIMYRRIKLKKYKEILDYYNGMLSSGKYDEILAFLKPYKNKYYIKVLVTNLYLYKGDEETYINMYDLISEKGKEKSFYYKLLHYTFCYYQFLINNINQIKLDKKFPLNESINYFNNGKYKHVINLIDKMQPFKSDFTNYIKNYIYISCMKSTRKDVDSCYQELDKYIKGNEVLRKHLQTITSK